MPSFELGTTIRHDVACNRSQLIWCHLRLNVWHALAQSFLTRVAKQFATGFVHFDETQSVRIGEFNRVRRLLDDGLGQHLVVACCSLGVVARCPYAQGSNTEGKIVGQFAEKRQFGAVEGVSFSGVKSQRAKAALVIPEQGQGDG